MDIKKITFIIGMILIIGPKIAEKFIEPLPKSITITSALVGLVVVILGAIVSENIKKK